LAASIKGVKPQVSNRYSTTWYIRRYIRVEEEKAHLVEKVNRRRALTLTSWSSNPEAAPTREHDARSCLDLQN
jgi:hypothetical protein